MLYRRCPCCGWGCVRCVRPMAVPCAAIACIADLWASDCEVNHPCDLTALSSNDREYSINLTVTVHAVLSLSLRLCVSAFPCVRQPLDIRY